MAAIKPFCGARFSLGKISDLSRVVSQPYDKIPNELQAQYYALHPHNIVRIERGQESPADCLDGPNIYTRARAFYDQWLAEGVLVCEERPAIYVYHQTFTAYGRAMTRKGLIAALELSAFGEGVVLPHERTHAGPKLDRLRLLRALQVNTGQIFMLYSDPQQAINSLLERAVAGRAPDMDAIELMEQDVHQQVWIVTDEAVIRAVQAEMAPKRNLIIADGHHRYETALNYRQQMRQEHPDAPPDAAFNYCMATLVSLQDPGLVILPTHREIFDVPISGADVLQRAAPYFGMREVTSLDACLSAMKKEVPRHAFGLFAENGYHVLVLKNPEWIEQLIVENRSLAWKSLDVSILHKVVLEQIVKLPEEAVDRQTNIRYHRDPVPAVLSVQQGHGTLVFFLNPTPISQVQVCATQGDKMPQKSTDFYPKVITGLTMMPVSAEEKMV